MPDTIYASFTDVARRFADRTALMRKVDGVYAESGPVRG